MGNLFQSIDVDVSDCAKLFQIIDIDGSGGMNGVELVTSIMHLRGHAKAMQVALLLHEMRFLSRDMQTFMVTVEDNFSKTCHDVENIRKSILTNGHCSQQD